MNKIINKITDTILVLMCLAYCILFFVIFYFQHNPQRVYAPELFGNATMITLDVVPNSFTVGVIYNNFTLFVFKEKETDGFIHGKMVHVLGSPITNADKPIPYLKHYNENRNRFTGWIDFREHERPFCGSFMSDLPETCRWR